MTVHAITQKHHRALGGDVYQNEPLEETARVEILLAAQLGYLASQHHRSEYNCQKYGPKGAPLAYVPLSLHLPEHFGQLLAQQALYANRQAWWPCRRPSPTFSKRAISSDGPTLVRVSRDPRTLQEDLLNAISSPLTAQPEEGPFVPDPTPPIKTSQSHPLNISVMIPFELIIAVTTHLIPAVQPSPIVFEIPPSYQLHHIISVPPQLIPPPICSPPAPLTSLYTKPSRPASAGFVNLLWNQKLMRKTFSLSSDSPTRVSANSNGTSLGKKPGRPNNISPTLAPRPFSSTDYSEGSHENEKPHRLPAPIMPSPAGIIHRSSSYAPPDTMTKSSSMMGTKEMSAFVPQRLGNLFLSSCPGKKVRLSGPVNGRGGVCRDLTQDLRRIKELGVGCVVCCLDDEELQYLGAPWEEYACVADELGLDVLRIPTPEGLAPADPAVLDGHLARLIEAYTLRGTPILVHCRGGVGRAGLVACCWALKLGLCGWIETQPNHSSRLSFTAPENLSDIPPLEGAHYVRRDTLQLVERAITLARRRRSYKAVETFEQVKFLADYVEFLRKKSQAGGVTVGSVMDYDARLR